MTNPDAERLVGENRCWPCTVSNAIVAVIVAGIPLLGAIVNDDPTFMAVTSVWAVAVLSYTLYRLVSRGYLPGSERIAKKTGLHERIGPGAGKGGSETGPSRDDRGN